MEDNKFWLKLWTRIAVVFITLILSTSTCQIHTEYLMDKEIMLGKDPIAVRCAFNGFVGESNTLICSKK